jgi:hypothetical protein
MNDWKYGVLKTHAEVRAAEEQLILATQRLEQARRLLNDAIAEALFNLGSSIEPDADGVIPLDERTFLFIARRGEQTDVQIKEVLDGQ